MVNTITEQLSIGEYRQRYVALHQESADFLNELIEQSGSLAVPVEEAALAGGLAVHSTLDKRFYTHESITDSDGYRVDGDPFVYYDSLPDNVEPGTLREDHSVNVFLPDAGEFNKRYISNPSLRVHERRVGHAITFLRVALEAGGGTVVGRLPGQSPVSIDWDDSRDTGEGLRVAPALRSAKWTGRNLITGQRRVEDYFRPAEALVNALKGLAGEFLER
jgi:hypothetical protein